MTRAVLMIAVLFLAGCASREERAARYTALDDKKCQGLGAKPGTDIYIQCRLVQQQRRDAQDAADDEFDARAELRRELRSELRRW